MRCSKCGGILRKTDRREKMVELNEDATDGQQADYFAAELSGDRGVWNTAIIEYHCARCSLWYELQHEELPDYRALIAGWHKKAAEGDDDFSRFVFEYLAFIAHLKNNLFFGAASDRAAIQSLKRDSKQQGKYKERVKNDKHLAGVVQQLLEELNKHPLQNSSFDLDYPEIDRWWNSNGLQPNTDATLPRGVIRSVDDWENLVEFWCSVRNNLFHGGKNPNVERDCFLVEHAFETLKDFMDQEIRDHSMKSTMLIAPG